jgi:hypothetical protein
MKLYEAPRYSTIKLEDGTVLDFHHIDGMYSYCTDSEGRAHHIAAWANVEIVSHYEQKPTSMSKEPCKSKVPLSICMDNGASEKEKPHEM